VARIHELIRQIAATNPELASDVEREFDALSHRRAFGLNFERHTPEAVELPGRPVRRGDKVHVLPPRGESPKAENSRLWRVTDIADVGDARVATLEALFPVPDGMFDTSTAAVNDLVVVAEFRDPIYPGLVSTGKVERGGGGLGDPGDKPYHAVINAENFHALQTLLFTHRGKVDAIYIDPPYNTGARDWKYNNDYVESDDVYRHSKWLAFMERRLLFAKELLNPDDSVLIVTIDEKEYLRLGLLLQQVFPEATMQMVSSLVNAKGTGRANEFRRVDEYVYFLWFGGAELGRLPKLAELESAGPDEDAAEGTRSALAEAEGEEEGEEVGPDDVGGVDQLDWQTFRRRDLASRRGTSKGGPRQFYPIYVNVETGQIDSVGDPLPHGVPRDSAPVKDGCIAVFPIRKDGTEMNWSAVAPTFVARWKRGFARAGRATPDQPQPYIIQYLKTGSISDIESGRATIVGRRDDGSVIATYTEERPKAPTTQWAIKAHNAEHGGTGILKALLKNREFPFPKSLYAVEDAIRLFVSTKPNATIIDFFSGSGTTAHAVMRLNRQDGGHRVSISVTNNEVGADEQAALRAKGLRPGDPEWEQWGICDYITKPRIRAAIEGKTPDGQPIRGDYKFTDVFPMADGFDENVEFFTLTYEAPLRVQANRDFERIAPLLWMRAGSRGRRIETVPDAGWDVADAYGVLVDLDRAYEFAAAVRDGESVTHAFVVTDDERLFQAVVRDLPEHVEPVRLYESYLTNFRIDATQAATR